MRKNEMPISHTFLRQRWISFIITIALITSLFSLSTFAAEDGFTFTVSDVSAAKGETVNVPVTVTHNPGISEWAFHVVFDEAALSLGDAQAIDDDIDVEFTSYFDEERNNFFVDFWDSDFGLIESGDFVINLEFTVLADTGKHDVSVVHFPSLCLDGAYDEFDLGNVTTINGSITVGDGTDPEPSGIDVIALYGGTVSAATADQFTVTPNAANHYVIDEIYVDGVKLSGVQGLASYTTTEAPAKSIVASFAYTVNF
jgi:hypothetical protein